MDFDIDDITKALSDNAKRFCSLEVQEFVSDATDEIIDEMIIGEIIKRATKKLNRGASNGENLLQHCSISKSNHKILKEAKFHARSCIFAHGGEIIFYNGGQLESLAWVLGIDPQLIIDQVAEELRSLGLHPQLTTDEDTKKLNKKSSSS